MSDKLLSAARLDVEACAPDCPCQSVHLVMSDGDGDAFAAAAMSPATARSVAEDLRRLADIAEARQLQNAGRLS